MPTVTRSTFWPYAGDYPYIDLEVKGTLTFMTAYKTIDYITPTGEPRIWPGGPDAAKADGIDLAVKPWEFWLLVDGGRGEISCSDHGCHGFRYEIYNAANDTQVSIQVDATEATEIKAAVVKMLAEHPTLFSPHQTALYKPAHNVLAYPATARRFTHKPETAAPKESYAPKWPATQADIDYYSR
jgi:hypothetical protein